MREVMDRLALLYPEYDDPDVSVYPDGSIVISFWDGIDDTWRVTVKDGESFEQALDRLLDSLASIELPTSYWSTPATPRPGSTATTREAGDA